MKYPTIRQGSQLPVTREVMKPLNIEKTDVEQV
jgi:hypothetical protein